MHLYEAGVPLPYIRDILGHVELATTDIYARASTEACPNGTTTLGCSAGSPACEPSASN